MNPLHKAAQQALEALEEYQSKGAPFLACDGAVDALRAALAQEQAGPKPMHPELRKMWEEHFDRCFRAMPLPAQEQAEPLNLSDRAVQKRLAAQWGYVPAEQAEPDHETRAELAEQQVVQLAEERDHYRNLWQKAQQANHLTIERLRDALVASRIIDPAAVEDPDEYDDGVTLYRIEALHRRIA